MSAPLVLGAGLIRGVLSYRAAAGALAAMAPLHAAGEVATPPRSRMPMGGDWSVLVMPAASRAYWGIKVLSVTPEAPRRGRPRIEGTYVLFDAESNKVVSLLDGATVTGMRTSALSALAATRMVDQETVRLAVFGTGEQAFSHVEALSEVFQVESLHVWGRTAQGTSDLLSRLALGDAETGAGTPDSLRQADLVACCTNSSEPVFSAGDLTAQCIVAVGSHTPDAQELSAETVGACSAIVVEDVELASREAGDIVHALSAGTITVERLTDLPALLRGDLAVAQDRPRLFKSVGVAWQDLALAVAAYEAALAER